MNLLYNINIFRCLNVSKDSEGQDLEGLCKALALRERKDSQSHIDKTETQEAGVLDQYNCKKHNVTTEGVDLIKRLLAVDHTKR